MFDCGCMGSRMIAIIIGTFGLIVGVITIIDFIEKHDLTPWIKSTYDRGIEKGKKISYWNKLEKHVTRLKNFVKDKDGE